MTIRRITKQSVSRYADKNVPVIADYVKAIDGKVKPYNQDGFISADVLWYVDTEYLYIRFGRQDARLPLCEFKEVVSDVLAGQFPAGQEVPLSYWSEKDKAYAVAGTRTLTLSLIDVPKVGLSYQLDFSRGFGAPTIYRWSATGKTLDTSATDAETFIKAVMTANVPLDCVPTDTVKAVDTKSLIADLAAKINAEKVEVK